MNGRRWGLLAAVAVIFGGIGCLLGATQDPAAFFPAWLAAFVFWIAIPLGALTLVFVHDLTGGRWMITARPVLQVAIATMPLATLAFLPVLAGTEHLYEWARPGHAPLSNEFYLNRPFFVARFVIDAVLWNGLAAYALWVPRDDREGAGGLAWASGLGLLALAYSFTFASIDWLLSLEPKFWSSIFAMITGAGAFVTSLSVVLLAIVMRMPTGAAARASYDQHLADLAAILLAIIIFWIYTEFCQFLIVWEEDLSREIPWYLRRWAGGWQTVMYVAAGVGFVIPFFGLVSGRLKRNRGVVAAVAALVLGAHLLDVWWLVLPEFPQIAFGWVDVAAMGAIGGLWCMAFLWGLADTRRVSRRVARVSHG